MGDLGDKRVYTSTESLTRYSTSGGDDAENFGRKPVVANMEDMALKALHVDDDPSLNPWTFRMFILGRNCNLSSFVFSIWVLTQPHRIGTLCLRLGPCDYLLVQATICLGLGHFLDCN